MGKSPQYGPAFDMHLSDYSWGIISLLMAKQGLNGRGTRPMTDHWNPDKELPVSNAGPDNDC